MMRLPVARKNRPGTLGTGSILCKRQIAPTRN